MPSNRYYSLTAKSASTAELLLYDEIGSGYFDEGTTAKQFAEDLRSVRDVATLNVRINSPGGSVFDGFAIYNQLLRFPGRVEVDIDGLAASIASVIALAGRDIRMAKNALFMMHQPSGLVMGTPVDMRAMAANLEKVGEQIRGVYTDKTGMKPERVTTMMDEETWLTAEEAHKLGFVDTITGERAMTNHFDLSRYKRPPAVLTAQTGGAQRRAMLAHMQRTAAQLRRA